MRLGKQSSVSFPLQSRAWMLAAVVPLGLIAMTGCDSVFISHGPAALALLRGSGNDKIDSVGGTFVDTMVVHVTDEQGRSVPNATVTWTASTGTLSSDHSVTNGVGDAQVIWTFSYAPTAPIGPTVAVLTATTAANTAPVGAPVREETEAVVGTLMVDSVFAGPGNPLPVITGGNNQSGAVGTTLPIPITLRVVDQHGNPWTGGDSGVRWTVAGGSLDTTATPGQTATTSLSTTIRPDGTTQMYVTLGPAPGANNVTIRVSGDSEQSGASRAIQAINLTATETALAAP